MHLIGKSYILKKITRFKRWENNELIVGIGSFELVEKRQMDEPIAKKIPLL